MDMSNLNITCGDFVALKNTVELIGIPGKWTKEITVNFALTAEQY